MNSEGAISPRSGWLPAEQRLDSDDREVRERDDRLVFEPELIALERAAQIVLHPQARDRPAAHALVEHLVPGAASVLGPVHRRVRVADQLIRALPAGGERDPDAGRDEMLASREHERTRERSRDPLRGVDRVALGGDVLEQDSELIAPESRHRVAPAQRMLEARRRGRQQLVSDVMAEAVVDQLEVVEVEEQDRGQRPLAAQARERVLEAVDEQHPVREPGQRVVHCPFADRVLDRLALERVGQHVRERLEEVDIAGGEFPRAHRLDHQDPERPARPALDLDREPGARPPASEVRLLEAALGVPVLNHHRRPAQQRVSRLRSLAGRVPQRSDLGLGPPDPAAENQAVLVGEELPHRRDLGAEHASGPVHRLVHQIDRARSLQRVLAEQRHRRLLRRAPLELVLDPLAVGDVVEHAVPADLAVLGLREHCVVADPDRMSVAMNHPVLERDVVGLDASEPVLARQDPVAVLRVQPLGPQPGVGTPFGGGVAEDLLDLRAHVVPASPLRPCRRRR